MQPITVFFFAVLIISIKLDPICFGLLSLRSFLNLYFSDLSIYSRVPRFDDSVRVFTNIIINIDI